jgi:hypothetical protein
MNVQRRMLKALLQPQSAIRAALRHVSISDFDLYCDLDLARKPAYAYGLQQATWLAKQLGISTISAIEFGVAGGRGLLELERLGELAEEATSVKVDTYGFDMGSGLPKPGDYRDLPYHWQRGFYAMDVDALRSKLRRSKLIIGDVASTVPAFLVKDQPAPIGFVAFDLDLYTSTVDALKLFDGPKEYLLPRVITYFDDTIGSQGAEGFHNHYVGELLAISEFNQCHQAEKIAAINGFEYRRLIPSEWNVATFMLHLFNHPQYNVYVGKAVQQLPL